MPQSPGTGVRTASSILLGIGGDIANFKSAAHLAAYAGIAPATGQSGTSIKRRETLQTGQQTLIDYCALYKCELPVNLTVDWQFAFIAPAAGAVMRSMTEGGPQPPIRNITQRSISRYGRFRIVFSCGQIDISGEKVRSTPITGHKNNCLRITIDFYGDSVYGHAKRK